jgi:hypothetical protein
MDEAIKRKNRATKTTCMLENYREENSMNLLNNKEKDKRKTTKRKQMISRELCKRLLKRLHAGI